MILQWLRSLEIDHLTQPLPDGGRWAHYALVILVILVMVDDSEYDGKVIIHPCSSHHQPDHHHIPIVVGL